MSSGSEVPNLDDTKEQERAVVFALGFDGRYDRGWCKSIEPLSRMPFNKHLTAIGLDL